MRYFGWFKKKLIHISHLTPVKYSISVLQHNIPVQKGLLFISSSPLAMEFHENLQSLAMKEGLKGSKVSRALESFSWNITILKVSRDARRQMAAFGSSLIVWLAFNLFSFLFSPQGQADLLKHAKAEVRENMKQVHDAALAGNLTKEGAGLRRGRSQTGRGQDEAATA